MLRAPLIVIVAFGALCSVKAVSENCTSSVNNFMSVTASYDDCVSKIDVSQLQDFCLMLNSISKCAYGNHLKNNNTRPACMLLDGFDTVNAFLESKLILFYLNQGNTIHYKKSIGQQTATCGYAWDKSWLSKVPISTVPVNLNSTILCGALEAALMHRGIQQCQADFIRLFAKDWQKKSSSCIHSRSFLSFCVIPKLTQCYSQPSIFMSQWTSYYATSFARDAKFKVSCIPVEQPQQQVIAEDKTSTTVQPGELVHEVSRNDSSSSATKSKVTSTHVFGRVGSKTWAIVGLVFFCIFLLVVIVCAATECFNRLKGTPSSSGNEFAFQRLREMSD